MRFHAPGRCPDCGTAVGTTSRCPGCGLLQVGPAADDLRATLHRADQVLDVLRRMSATPAPVPAPAPAPATASAPSADHEQPRPTAARPRRGLPAVSVPLVLLGLGTVCVLVAAVVFVAVSWTDLSLASRTTILLGVTAVAIAVAVWTLRQGLRGATDALTLVAGGLLLIDLLAGNDAGLPVLSALHGTAFGWLMALSMLGFGLAWVFAAQRTACGSLLGQELVAVAACVEALRLAVLGWDFALEWLAALATVVAALAAVVLWRLSVRVVAVALAVGALASWTVLVVLGMERALSTPGTAELFAGLGGVPLLVASALVALPAGTARLHPGLRRVSATAAVAGPVMVALLPARELAATPGVLVVATVAVALALAGRRLSSPWRHGLQVVGGGTAVLPGFVLVGAVLIALVRVLGSAYDAWQRTLGDPLAALVVAPPVQLWSLVPVGGLAVATVAAVLVRPRVVLAWAGCGVGVGAVTALLLTSWPLLWAGVVLAVAAAVSVVLAARTGSRWWLLPGGVLLSLGLLTALPSAGATTLFFAVHAVLLLASAARVPAAGRRWSVPLLAGGAMGLLGVCLEAAADLGDLAGAVRGTAVLLLAAAVAAVAQAVARRAHAAPWRAGLEGAAVLLAVVALAQVADDLALRTLCLAVVAVVSAGVAVVSRDRRPVLCGTLVFLAGTAHQVVQVGGGSEEWRAVAAATVAGLGALAAQALARPGGYDGLRILLEWTALLVAMLTVGGMLGASLPLAVGLTILGCSAVVVSLVSADRRRVAWLGSALLVAASWVRLEAVDVDTVEAYTLPGSLALLVAGLVRMRRTSEVTSWRALSAPLSLGVGPSLVVALDAPTSLRALLVGLVGVALVLVATRLQWGAPLLVGGGAVGLLALVNIAPYAAGLPRWILFGTAGVALLMLGLTWERRRRDLVVAHRYATRLR